MKSLQALHSQVGIQLNAKYYVPYLDKEEMEVINQAVKQKKSLRYNLNLLRLLALKIITELKRSALFNGEQRWTIAFADTEAALLNGQTDPRQLCQALHTADDLIESAWVTRAVRRDILVAVQERSVLSESQDRQYEAIRQAYLAHNEALTELDEQVYQVKNEFFQNPGRHSAAAAPVWKMVRRDFPSTLLNYRTGVYKIQLSDQNILQLIQAEGNVREVYQNLTARLMQKPTIETIAEDIQSAKVFLTDKATTIIDNAGLLRRAIIQQTQQAIEHRSQAKLAHAEKIERLLLILAKIMQLLQTYISREKTQKKIQPLSAMMIEAQAMQVALENSPMTIKASALEQKLLRLDTHRQSFAKSITSSWSAFFSSGRQTRQREQQLNIALQSAIAQMTTPLYGLNDSAAAITPEQVKQQHVTARQLDEKQGRANLEYHKVEKIKNTFAR